MQIPLGVALLAANAAAQVVLPAFAATQPPRGPYAARIDGNVFYGAIDILPLYSRSQFVYASQEVSVAGAVFRSLAVRRPFDYPGTNPPFPAQLTVVLSVSQQPYQQTSATFATNHGPTPVTVFSGPVAMPQRADPQTWPAPWEAPLPFATPFVFVRALAQSLVVEFSSVNATSYYSWILEAQRPDLGMRFDNPPNSAALCRFSNNLVLRSGGAPPVVGQPWQLGLHQAPGASIGVGVLGSGGAGTPWGGTRLPVDLGPFGAPRCEWNVTVDWTVPLARIATSHLWPVLQVPDDVALVQQSIYEQCVFVDPPANALGIVATPSSRWTVSGSAGVPAATVRAGGRLPPGPTGGVQRDGAITIWLGM
jgi:hypothetical protein